ncbi:MAG: transferase [Deltaproteobacteria bacterium]|nr:MAG: transferase [Deltaproteobacteria bacterium]
MANSHGSGTVARDRLASCGDGVVFEPGALVFHPENVYIGDDVYVGHYAILKGYYRNHLEIGDGAWIGQHAFLHAAGGLRIGRRVGIGPGVRIITSAHELPPAVDTPIMDGPLRFAPVVLEDGCDVGTGAIVLPGVTVGRGAQIGAGAVVTRDVPAGAVAIGVPARVVRVRS